MLDPHGFPKSSRYLSLIGLLSLVFLSGLAAPAAAKPPVLKQVFPPGAALGSTTKVQLGGDWDPWPVELTSMPAGLTWTAQETKGEVQVSVAADAAPGIYLVRAQNAEGVSAWRPFVVGTRPEVQEAEDNNEPTSAQQLDSSSVVINGRLAGRADVDVFSLTLEAGQTVVVAALANEVLGSPMDVTIQLCDSQGFVLKQVDDARKLDPLMVFAVPRSGQYLVRLMAFPADPNSSIAFSASDDYVYRLTITTGAFVDHYLPLAVQRNVASVLSPIGWNLAGQSVAVPAAAQGQQVLVADPTLAESARLPLVDVPVVQASETASLESPQDITIPSIVSGHIEQPEDVDTFRFNASAQQEITFEVDAQQIGFELDPVLTLTDASGQKLSEVDDVRNARDPELRFQAPADGAYQLSIRDLHGHGGLRYAYVLKAGLTRPPYTVRPAQDAIAVATGAAVELALDIDRRRGFNETVQVTAEGLPDGCEFTVPVSEKEGDSSKKVTAKLTAACAAGTYRFRLLSKSESETAAAPIHFEVAGVAYDEVWLTVTAP